MVRITENRSLILVKFSLKCTNEIKVREMTLGCIDELPGVSNFIGTILIQIHPVMRELECNLFIWAHLIIEWQSHSTGLKINEMKWKFPVLHLIFEAGNIQICITMHLVSVIFQNRLVSCCHSNMQPLALIMVKTNMFILTMSHQIRVSKILHEVLFKLYVLITLSPDILTGHILNQRLCRCRWIKASI